MANRFSTTISTLATIFESIGGAERLRTNYHVVCRDSRRTGAAMTGNQILAEATRRSFHL